MAEDSITPSGDGDSTRKKRKPARMSRRKRWLFRVAAVVLPILLLEGAARLYWSMFVPKVTNQDQFVDPWHGAASDDGIPYEFPPNHQLDVSNTPTRTNNLGLRGDKEIDTQADRTRIVCIGDSVTFGYTVSDNDHAYPALLEQKIQPANIEVINAGMPRFRVAHMANLFEVKLAQLKPEYVIVLGGWNDANDNVLRPVPNSPGVFDFLNERWYTLKVVRHWDILPQAHTAEHPPAMIDDAGFDKYEQGLRRLVHMSRAAGATPFLCTLPHFYGKINSESARAKAREFTPVGTLEQIAQVAEAMNQRILHVAASENVQLIDLRSIDDPELFADAIHPNDEGTARIAQIVADHLRNYPLSY